MLGSIFQSIRLGKKLRYYVVILIILWSGAVWKALEQGSFNPVKSVDALERSDSTVLIEEGQKGYLALPEKEKKAETILYRFKAEIIQSIKTEELFTIYAYTPLLDEYIVVENEKINLNLVYYFDEGKDETVLILATPIYNEDY